MVVSLRLLLRSGGNWECFSALRVLSRSFRDRLVREVDRSEGSTGTETKRVVGSERRLRTSAVGEVQAGCGGDRLRLSGEARTVVVASRRLKRKQGSTRVGSNPEGARGG